MYPSFVWKGKTLPPLTINPYNSKSSHRAVYRMSTNASRLTRMDEDERLTQYLELCQRIYERMEQNDSFPWPDSTDSEDVVESEHSKNDV